MQNKLIYYAATSIDGFIADSDGGIEWMNHFMKPDEDYGFHAFFSGIDSLILGSATYQKAVSITDKSPYQGKPCWVLSTRTIENPWVYTTISSMNPVDIYHEIRAKGYKNTWLVGGGKLATSFLKAGLLDEFLVSVMPVILGNGINLFESGTFETRMKLIDTKQYSGGVMQNHYLVK